MDELGVSRRGGSRARARRTVVLSDHVGLGVFVYCAAEDETQFLVSDPRAPTSRSLVSESDSVRNLERDTDSCLYTQHGARGPGRAALASWGAWQPRKTHGYTYVQWKSLQPTATRRRNGPRIDVGARYSCRIRSLDRASDEPTAAGGGAGASCCPLPGRLAVVGVGHAQALFDFVIRFM